MVLLFWVSLLFQISVVHVSGVRHWLMWFGTVFHSLRIPSVEGGLGMVQFEFVYEPLSQRKQAK